jgi:hypothetical protein
VGGLLGSLSGGVWYRSGVVLFGLGVGLTCGLRFALKGGSMRVSLAELVFATTGAGRVKFIRMLESAHHRQVLRQAGAVYQFRHAELQDHLGDIHRKAHPAPD